MKTKITLIIAIFAVVLGIFALTFANPTTARAQFDVEDSGSTAGPTVSGDSDNGSNGGSSSRKRGGSRVVVQTVVTFSDITIERAGTNSLRISWTTNPESYGRIVFGDESVMSPIANTDFHGYDTGSGYTSDMTARHSVVVFMEAGKTYYFRPVALIKGRPAYGAEYSVTPVKDTTAPRVIDLDQTPDDSEVIIDLSKATSTLNDLANDSDSNKGEMSPLRATVIGAGNGIKNVFKNLWNNLFGKDVCPVPAN